MMCEVALGHKKEAGKGQKETLKTSLAEKTELLTGEEEESYQLRESSKARCLDIHHHHKPLKHRQ